MILVDTSVWADHLARSDDALLALLSEGEVLVHRFVIAELALGNLRHPRQTIVMLERLPAARIASHGELIELIAGAGLAGSGVGFVDAHLLAACRLTPGARLWTRDRRLASKAGDLDIGWVPD
jgi:predicted nucleic acid-binding protein